MSVYQLPKNCVSSNRCASSQHDNTFSNCLPKAGAILHFATLRKYLVIFATSAELTFGNVIRF